MSAQPVLPLGGIVPVVPTTFTAAGELDLASQKRAVDYLIDAGSHALCILANYSEQFSLDGREREVLTDVVIGHVAGRVPVIVTTTHFSTLVAAERSRRAQAAGASMVMLMPPYHGAGMSTDEAGVRDHFAAVADGLDIPIMLQDHPISGTSLSAAALARLAREIPALHSFKVESGVVAEKIRALVAAGGDAIEGILDGHLGITLLADLEAGATGTMPGGVSLEALRRTWDLWAAGRRGEATAEFERILPIIVYEYQLCGFGATKALMAEAGIIASEAVRAPLRPLSPTVRAGLLALARRLDLPILRWGREPGPA